MSGPADPGVRLRMYSMSWVAVKKLKLRYHSTGIWQIIGFPYYSNLI